jgi:hypothetical protein
VQVNARPDQVLKTADDIRRCALQPLSMCSSTVCARGIVHLCRPLVVGSDHEGDASARAGGGDGLNMRDRVFARVHFDNGVILWLNERNLLPVLQAPRVEMAYASAVARQLSRLPPMVSMSAKALRHMAEEQ